MSYPNSEDNDLAAKEAHAIAQKDQILRQVLSPEERLRLNNVKMVKPELANAVENYLINLAAQGQASGQISDEQLKQILTSAQQPKRDFKINRI